MRQSPKRRSPWAATNNRLRTRWLAPESTPCRPAIGGSAAVLPEAPQDWLLLLSGVVTIALRYRLWRTATGRPDAPLSSNASIRK